MARKARKSGSTIDAILKVMHDHGPAKQMAVKDIIAAVDRPATTVYSVVYAEAKKENPRIVQVARGTFKLTAAGRKAVTP
jgi:hypothetical protein